MRLAGTCSGIRFQFGEDTDSLGRSRQSGIRKEVDVNKLFGVVPDFAGASKGTYSVCTSCNTEDAVKGQQDGQLIYVSLPTRR